MAGFAVRRVVTGHDASGRAVFVEDGVPARTFGSLAGPALSELLWLDGPAKSADDGGDPPDDLHGGFPSGGAIAARLIRFPGFAAGTPVEETWLRMPGDDPARPGLHRSQTLDLMVVLDGHITLGLDDGEHPLGPGDAVIQRGTVHRWRVVGEQSCTFLSVLLSPESPESTAPTASDEGLQPVGGGDQPAAVHRLVTGTGAGGRSRVTATGPAPSLQGEAVSLYDLWQTGGPLIHVEQGGDAPGPWSLEPAAAGVALRRVEFATGHDPGPGGIHATATIDVGLLLSGTLELALPDDGELSTFTSTVLNAGDVVIQRGTLHRWRPVGPDGAVLVSVMIGLR